MFAVTALAAASASAAEPLAFEKCVKATKVGKTFIGKYTAKTCTTASEVETGGKYEREEVESGTTFTSKSKAVTITVNGKIVKCKKGVDAGEFLSGEAEALTITFSSCGINGNKKEPCTTEPAAAGTIVTNKLVGELKYVNPAETEIGVLLFKSGAGFPFAKFTCGAEVVELHSILVGSVTNTTKGMTFGFKVSGGKQEHRAYWEEEEETTGFGESIPFHLITEPGKKEATIEVTDEQGPKGVSAF
jgi:hypothetical protein